MQILACLKTPRRKISTSVRKAHFRFALVLIWGRLNCCAILTVTQTSSVTASTSRNASCLLRVQGRLLCRVPILMWFRSFQMSTPSCSSTKDHEPTSMYESMRSTSLASPWQPLTKPELAWLIVRRRQFRACSRKIKPGLRPARIHCGQRWTIRKAA